MPNEDLPKLLRASAGGTQAQENRHDIILNAAADEIEKLRRVSADLLEAAQLLEAAELGRQNCEECDGGEGEPEARGIGEEATENPFTPLTKAWLDWADGWKDADEFFVNRNLDL